MTLTRLSHKHLLPLLVLTLAGSSACGYSKAVTMPELKGFVTVKDQNDEGVISRDSPFMYHWRNPRSSELRNRLRAKGQYSIYIAPVDTEFLELEKKSQGFSERVEAIATYLREKITETVNDYNKGALKARVVENRNEADFELLLQISEIGFGSPALYTAAWLVPLPGTATTYDANYTTVLSLEGKLVELTKEKDVVAEVIDRRISKIRILDLNKVFSKRAPLRDICNDYSTLFARALSTPPDEKVESVSKFTLIPW